MASLDADKLIQAICNEDDTANAKCSFIAGKDVILLIGCCGSGKTTVSVYIQGGSFTVKKNKLEAGTSIEGFVMGDQRADVTHGLAFAEVPRTDGLFLVDSAGTGATAGATAEICGAINRCAALQSARSVRAALVMNAGRIQVGNERGKHAIRDLDHIAGMFTNISDNLSSIGRVVTADPKLLIHDGAAEGILLEIKEALEGLREHAVAGEDFVDLGQGVERGMAMTSAGKQLLEALCAECQKASNVVEHAKEGDDDAIVAALSRDRIAVFPVNVSRDSQRESLQKWLAGLMPVKNPASTLTYNLPCECSAVLTSLLSSSFLACKDNLAMKGMGWASDQGLVAEVVILLRLANILESKELLPWAATPKADLCEHVLQQNKAAVALLLEGVRSGNSAKLESAQQALLDMDSFRKKCHQGTKLSGWTNAGLAFNEAVQAAQESVEGALPGPPGALAEVKWDLNLAHKVGGIFAAVEQLRTERGTSFLEGWATKILEQVHNLKLQAAECASASSTTQALTRLEEHKEFLPNTVIPTLSKFGCTSLQDDGIGDVLNQAKDAVKSNLRAMSCKMVEHIAKSEKSDVQDLLQQLCRSTELNALLQEHLEDRFLIQPLTAELAPGQEELDGLAAAIESSPCDQWCSELSHLAQRVDAVTDLGPQLIKTGNLSFSHLISVTCHRIAAAKVSCAEAARRLASPCIQQRKWSVLSISGETCLEANDDDSDQDGEKAEESLDELKHLQPIDSLLQLFGRPAADTTKMAIQSVSWTLKESLQKLLKKANKARNAAWNLHAALDAETFQTIYNLKGLASLAEVSLRILKTFSEATLNNLPASLEEKVQEATQFIDNLVTKELDGWDEVTTKTKGWLDMVDRHIRMASKLQHLSMESVREASQKLHQKVIDWHEECLSLAKSAAEHQDKWHEFIHHAVQEGLVFEESPLFERLHFKTRFRALVDAQAELLQKAAKTANQDLKLQSWQQLTAIITALEQLVLLREDQRTAKLIADLKKARQPLDESLNDSESRFLKALQEKRYPQAFQLLNKVQNVSRHLESLREQLKEDLESSLKSLDNDGEVEEVVQAAKRAHMLVRDVDNLDMSETLVLIGGLHSDLKLELAKKTSDAIGHLQCALEGRRPPSSALAICAAFCGKSKAKTATEALSKFTSEKKHVFSSMSCTDLVSWIIQHDAACRSMPEELKANTADMEELLKVFFACFDKSFKKDLETLHGFQDKKKWGEAKQICQQLRDAIDNVLDLDILKPFKSQLRPLKQKIGYGSSQRCHYAKEEIKQGEFLQAICTLVTADGSEAEHELCEAINEALIKNMRLSVTDESCCQQRLAVLKSFLEAVGDHPPDELRGLWREVRARYHETKPQMEEKAVAAVQEAITAASQVDPDLGSLANALAHCRMYGDMVDAEQRIKVQGAVQGFLERIITAMTKVESDIEGLDVQSLSMNMEPLKIWLACAQQLKPEAEKALLEHFHGEPADLQAWMLGFLASPLQKLVDAATLVSLLEVGDFSDISRRYKVAQKAHAVLRSPLVDLSPIAEHMVKRKDAAINALGSGTNLPNFNAEVKVLKAAALELPELHSVSNHVMELETAFKAKVLNGPVRNLGRAKTVTEAVQICIEMRTVANQAPDMHEVVTSMLNAALRDLQNNPEFTTKGITTLGMQLGTTQIGQAIILEHAEVFGAVKDMHVNAIFRRAGETHNLDDVVGRLTQQSKLGAEEYWELVNALQAHECLLGELKQRYLLSGRPIDAVLDDARCNTQAAAERCADKSSESALNLLTHLAASFMVVKCGKAFLEALPSEQSDRLVTPHRAQMLTLFRLLHAHRKGKDSLFRQISSWVQGAVGMKDDKKVMTPENHLAQVLTGEGKCLTLGMLASFLALIGVESDVVCYRKCLTDQDKRAMLPFYKFLGIDDKVRYLTFDELCSERLQSITRSSKNLLEPELAAAAVNKRDLSQRALLIDEVDVLFGRRFYGQTWDGGFKLDSDEAVDLVRFIFEEKMCGRPVNNITRTVVFKSFLQKYPSELHPALTGIAMVLVKSVEDWAKPEPILDEETGRIGYKENDEVNYELCYSNKTVFAYLSHEKQGVISSETAAAHLGVDLLCGRFSFADLPNRYCCILGVTGTLRELLSIKGLSGILQMEYGFKHFTYTPSIFGERQLLFREAEHVHAMKNEADWMSRVEQVVEDESKQGNAVLVFFKNEEQLKKYPNWQRMECLTERTDPSRRNGYIAAATMKGRVTLLTRAFGRGIDFQMPDTHMVVVVQTFLSSLISEDTQIKGRTARQGKTGKYLLVLCSEHLESKMGVTPQEFGILDNGNGAQIKNLLASKQRWKTQNKAAGMTERRKKASAIEKATKHWEEMLCSTTVPDSEKLKKLAAWNGTEAILETHYTLLLDISGSMSGTPMRQLIKAVQHFQQELVQLEQQGAPTKVSTILFNHMAHVVTPTHAKASEMQDLSGTCAGGGTNFCVAFSKYYNEVINRSASHTKELIIFLTDGQASHFPEREIKHLLADHGSRIQSLTCVAFGQYADASTLRSIGAIFQSQQIAFKLTTPADEASLVQTFVEAASSRAIHYK
eukprot:TRINITY_DN102076_c0_g1_i1.p1 TRINITY_DN102076_c0_g1~~TRINITY_DN102076_c0_g1_i1.p1  ORF type:complete len:2570 (+),score=578.81 TRINITY_DN102076_c0_g1_i1:70-7779(+)